MIEQDAKDRVANARVHIHNNGKRFGCGVLVNGGYILTAAHCVSATSTQATMSRIEDKQDFLVTVETAAGAMFKCETIAVECCADIAVLGRANGYIPDCTEDRETFDQFAKDTLSLSLSVSVPVCDAFILNHQDTWVTGKVRCEREHAPRNIIKVYTDQRIQPGSSGSPIVDVNGRLLSIVSNVICFEHASAPFAGEHPNLMKSLPVCLFEAIASNK